MEMHTSSGMRMPVHLLVLDAIGTVFLGVGGAKLAGVDLLPWKSPIEDYGIPFVLLGLVLMAPFVLHLVKHARRKPEPGGS